jgi:hypothetical protein
MFWLFKSLNDHHVLDISYIQVFIREMRNVHIILVMKPQGKRLS